MKPGLFIPDPAPPRSDISLTRHGTRIGSATATLARFDGLLRSIQDS